MTPADERNSGYVDEYQGGQKTVYISPWFYECMSGNTYNWKDNPFVRIKDPRIPYYFYNQVAADGDAANKTDYRDGAFISIVFGSNSGFTSMTQEKAMTTLGIYPVGGKFDKGEGTPIDAKSGNGIAPDKMLMAYSVPFMKAELILAGEASGDAKEELKKGIASSIAHVNSVTAAADPTAPKLEGDAVTDFIDAVLAKYDAANDNRKMEIVMTQKWIANFYNPVEAYNDIRRTGYPVLFKGDAENLAWSPYAQEVEATPGLVSFELVNLLDALVKVSNKLVNILGREICTIAAGSILGERLLHVFEDIHIVDDDTARFTREHTISSSDGLHQRVVLHRLVQIQGR